MSDTVPAKTCTRCGETKPLDRFVINRRAADGRRRYCKSCQMLQRSRNVVPVSEKRCNSCAEVLPRQLFHRNKSTRDGLQGWCIACTKKRAVERAQSRQAAEKACAHCGTTKAAEQFGPDKFSTDGLRPYCRPCRRLLHAAERERERAEMTQKWCAQCRQHLPVAEFGRNRRSRSGLQAWCRGCSAIRQAETYLRYQERYRWTSIEKQFGITRERYQSFLATQRPPGGVCRKPALDLVKKLAVDHCHHTGVVRGLLCGLCNPAVGMLGDNLAGVLRAVVYLARVEVGGTVDDWMPKIDDVLRQLTGEPQWTS